MSEQAPAPAPKAKEPLVIEALDTTKTGVKSYLEDAGSTLKAPLESARAMRLAVFRFIMDTCKITDRPMRQQAWRQFDATPGWFGCNNSAGRQALGIKSALEAVVEEIEA